jgi:hypothetical protein
MNSRWKIKYNEQLPYDSLEDLASAAKISANISTFLLTGLSLRYVYDCMVGS